MAFIRQQEDEEQQVAAPTLAPGAGKTAGGMVSGGGIGGALTAPQQTPQQKAGSGTFTNLSSWLNAGNGRDKQISTAGNAALTGEKTAFTTAKDPVEKASFTATTATNDEIKNVLTPQTVTQPSSGSISSGSGYVADPSEALNPFNAPKPAAAPGKTLDDLKKMITQSYDGPRAIDYDVNNRAGLRRLDNLAATNTTGAELVGPDAQYGSGNRRLDTTLFGADINSQNAIGANKKGGQDFIGQVGTDTKRLGDKVAGFDKAASDARSQTMNQITSFGDTVLGGIEQRVKEANDKQDAMQLNRTSDSAVPDGFELGDWVGDGTRASAGNIMNATESEQLARLRSLIGGDKYNIQDTGDFKSGYYGLKAKDVPDFANSGNNPRMEGIDAQANANPDYAWDGEKLVRVGNDWFLSNGKFKNKKTGEELTPDEALARKEAEKKRKQEETIANWRG